MTTINPYYKAAAELQLIDISFEEYQSHYIEEDAPPKCNLSIQERIKQLGLK